MPRKKKEAAPAAVLEIPVAYGNLNVGDISCRLGLSAHRGNLTVSQADKNLCGKRLTVTILARAGNGQANQESLPGLEGSDATLTGVADVKQFGVGVKHISFGLTFAIESIDIPTLALFARREGTLTVTDVTDIPEGEKEGGDED